MEQRNVEQESMQTDVFIRPAKMEKGNYSMPAKYQNCPHCGAKQPNFVDNKIGYTCQNCEEDVEFKSAKTEKAEGKCEGCGASGKIRVANTSDGKFRVCEDCYGDMAKTKKSKEDDDMPKEEKEKLKTKKEEENEDVEKAHEEPDGDEAPKEKKKAKKEKKDDEQEVEKEEELDDEEEDPKEKKKTKKGSEGSGLDPEEDAADNDSDGNTTSPGAGVPSNQHVAFGPKTGDVGRNASGTTPGQESYAGKSVSPELMKSPLFLELDGQIEGMKKAFDHKLDALNKSMNDRLANIQKGIDKVENFYKKAPLYKAVEDSVGAEAAVKKGIKEQIAEGKVRYSN